MELAIAVAVGCAVVLFALLRGGSDPSRSIVDLWGFRPLGWPSGVQEDDDLHWSWVAPGSEPPGAEPDVIDAAPRQDPELIDVRAGRLPSAGSMRVDVQRVIYVVRSVDRARS